MTECPELLKEANMSLAIYKVREITQKPMLDGERNKYRKIKFDKFVYNFQGVKSSDIAKTSQKAVSRKQGICTLGWWLGWGGWDFRAV